ncbi:aldehyde dehydrogenase [Cristinia sonorae]|uniref:Aldehyde dehydrogenase n=1 Tax=Cristinia sonorae TaxID=1940300 RepID=A0A8K0XKL6_9AGAR|nr:aldehyde dehydrogenase [Cristinia sonorae]
MAAVDSLPFTHLFIDGQQRPASDHKFFAIRNPYTRNVVGYAAAASKQDCLDAIETADKAFMQWQHSTLEQRRTIFLKVADLLLTERYGQKIAAAVNAESAAADHVIQYNIFASASAVRDIACATSELAGRILPSQVPGGQVFIQRRPKGVIFGISPWNVPILLSVRAVGIPILCGNTAILKCSEATPRSQAIVFELFQEAGLPNGVLNFISMDRDDASELTKDIIAHPLVRKINFTGSDVVGKIIAAEAAKHLKECILELGGKAPVVVLNDADLPKAAKAIVSSALIHSGQACMSTERVLIQRKVSENLIPLIVELMMSMTVGDTSEKTGNLSSLFSEASASRIVEFIEEAKKDGAEVLVGDGKNDGAVIRPHILTGCRPGMKIWDRETFGPVLVISVADTVEELISLANASDYSLAAGVWSGNLATAMNVAGRIRAGFTNINGPTVHIEGNKHFGLGGASGYGRFDVESFTDMRWVVVHPDGPIQYPLVG